MPPSSFLLITHRRYHQWQWWTRYLDNRFPGGTFPATLPDLKTWVSIRGGGGRVRLSWQLSSQRWAYTTAGSLGARLPGFALTVILPASPGREIPIPWASCTSSFSTAVAGGPCKQREPEAASRPACLQLSLGMSRGLYHGKAAVRRKGGRREALPVKTQLGRFFCAGWKKPIWVEDLDCSQKKNHCLPPPLSFPYLLFLHLPQIFCRHEVELVCSTASIPREPALSPVPTAQDSPDTVDAADWAWKHPEPRSPTYQLHLYLSLRLWMLRSSKLRAKLGQDSEKLCPGF